MFPLQKLGKLSGRHRQRKVALLLGELERGLLGGGEAGEALLAYGRGLAAFLAADSEASEEIRGLARAAVLAVGRSPVSGALGEEAPDPGVAKLASRTEAEGLRALDALRHALLRETGQAPADWDLLDPATGRLDGGRRLVRPGIRVYLEDIRSPFNLGSMMRTADAFGVEELILSPGCADPAHPRAARSAMGAAGLLPIRRAGFEALEEFGPAFALELGGTPLGDFEFPERGIVVLGSEELGVSELALASCPLGKVSIPMSGAKASLNVGVAFGILMQAWTSSIGFAD